MTGIDKKALDSVRTSASDGNCIRPEYVIALLNAFDAAEKRAETAEREQLAAHARAAESHDAKHIAEGALDAAIARAADAEAEREQIRDAAKTAIDAFAEDTDKWRGLASSYYDLHIAANERAGLAEAQRYALAKASRALHATVLEDIRARGWVGKGTDEAKARAASASRDVLDAVCAVSRALAATPQPAPCSPKTCGCNDVFDCGRVPCPSAEAAPPVAPAPCEQCAALRAENERLLTGVTSERCGTSRNSKDAPGMRVGVFDGSVCIVIEAPEGAAFSANTPDQARKIAADVLEAAQELEPVAPASDDAACSVCLAPAALQASRGQFDTTYYCPKHAPSGAVAIGNNVLALFDSVREQMASNGVHLRASDMLRDLDESRHADEVAERRLGMLRELLRTLPKCDACDAPATRGWVMGAERFCDVHGRFVRVTGALDAPDAVEKCEVDEYPRAPAIRAAQREIAASEGPELALSPVCPSCGTPCVGCSAVYPDAPVEGQP